jgi:integrase
VAERTLRFWHSENPIQWVERKEVPNRHHETLRREQIRPLLDALPNPVCEDRGIASPWRWAAAIMLYTGVRPGEAFGFWNSDVNLVSGTLSIQRSWSHAQFIPSPDGHRPPL